MNNLKKMQSILMDGKIDAILLTAQVSRLYAAGYDIPKA